MAKTDVTYTARTLLRPRMDAAPVARRVRTWTKAARTRRRRAQRSRPPTYALPTPPTVWTTDRAEVRAALDDAWR